MNINTEFSPSSPAPIEAPVQTKKLRPQRSKEEWFSLLDIWYASDIRANAFLAQYDLSVCVQPIHLAHYFKMHFVF